VVDTLSFGLQGRSLSRPGPAMPDLRKYAWIGGISADITACRLRTNLGPKTIA